MNFKSRILLLQALFFVGLNLFAQTSGFNSHSPLIAMAQRWSQDVCRQLGKHISATLVASLA